MRTTVENKKRTLATVAGSRRAAAIAAAAAADAATADAAPLSL